jgi:hypothetical protein
MTFPRSTLSAAARGYDAEPRRRRKALALIVDAGMASCAKCGRWIQPGTPWHLGHTADRTGWTGPEHAACNIRDAAIRANRRSRGLRDRPLRTSRTW